MINPPGGTPCGQWWIWLFQYKIEKREESEEEEDDEDDDDDFGMSKKKEEEEMDPMMSECWMALVMGEFSLFSIHDFSSFLISSAKFYWGIESTQKESINLKDI